MSEPFLSRKRSRTPPPEPVAAAPRAAVVPGGGVPPQAMAQSGGLGMGGLGGFGGMGLLGAGRLPGPPPLAPDAAPGADGDKPATQAREKRQRRGSRQPNQGETAEFDLAAMLAAAGPQAPPAAAADDDAPAPPAASSAPMAAAPDPFAGPHRPSRSVRLPQVPEARWQGAGAPTMTAGLIAHGESGGLTLINRMARGVHVSEPAEALADQPQTLDFRGYRSRQFLHHNSEVLKWHLEQTENPDATKEARAAAKRKVERAKAKAKAGGKGKGKAPAGGAGDDGGASSSAAAKKPKAGSRKKKAEADPTVFVDPGPQTYTPVEVQTRYLERGGALSLTVTANEPASQEYLAGMSQADVLQAYEDAAALQGSSQSAARIRSAARKVLAIEAQNEIRRSKPKREGSPAERAEDLNRAAGLAALARSGRFTVIKNLSGTRHAEQVLEADGAAQTKAAETAGTDVSQDATDVAGSYIRCGACGVSLGPDEVYTHIHDQSDPKGAPHPHLTGTFYAREMEPRRFDEAAPEYVTAPDDGRARAMSVGPAERARSRSPPPPYRPRRRPAAAAAAAMADDGGAPPSVDGNAPAAASSSSASALPRAPPAAQTAKPPAPRKGGGSGPGTIGFYFRKSGDSSAPGQQ